MSETAIKVENLSKKYYIGANKSGSLRETLQNKFNVLFGKKNQSIEEFWALKDINFEVKQGEVLGIIGKNGAGKTTILKILSRITEPTTGRIEITGRVSSLLEVGTGFHPELTGRENIFLNGTILGMSRNEVKSKFDEIVDFSGIEKFLDTPVKRYSSGMYVRLAFAVAAHLDPEILIIDEVLAVGDAEFQKKCLGKMENVSKSGRTILFVSHQMGAITRLCNKAILLSKGFMIKMGETQKIIDYYVSNVSSKNETGFTSIANCGKDMFIAKTQALNTKGEPTVYFSHQEKIAVEITCQINKKTTNTLLGFYVRDTKGRKVFTSNIELPDAKHDKEQICVTATLPIKLLVPGQYLFTFAISIANIAHHAIVDLVEDTLTITIGDGGSKFSAYEGFDYGCVFADCQWSMDNSIIPNSW